MDGLARGCTSGVTARPDGARDAMCGRRASPECPELLKKGALRPWPGRPRKSDAGTIDRSTRACRRPLLADVIPRGGRVCSQFALRTAAATEDRDPVHSKGAWLNQEGDGDRPFELRNAPRPQLHSCDAHSGPRVKTCPHQVVDIPGWLRRGGRLALTSWHSTLHGCPLPRVMSPRGDEARALLVCRKGHGSLSLPT